MSLSTTLSGSTFNLSVPHDPITVQLDSSVVLPCRINPALNAAPFDVRWYRTNKAETTVLYYENEQIQETSVDPQYRGRASLIGVLEKGDVSMKLENLTVADRGGYMCFVKSPTWYERASLSLNMKVVGSEPVLSYMEKGKDKFNVSCVSDGWSDQPVLIWRDRQGEEITDNPVHEHSTDADGLVSVRSWLLVSPSKSEWMSCSVFLSSDQEMRESRILPQITRAETDTVSPSSTGPWKAAFIALLVLVLLGISLVFLSYHKGYINIGKQTVSEERPPCAGQEETVPLTCQTEKKQPTTDKAMNTITAQTTDQGTNTVTAVMDDKSTMSDAQIIKIPELDTVKGNAVQLTLDSERAPPFLNIQQDGKSVTCSDPNKQAAHGDQHPHVVCKERLRSQQHYWEVAGHSGFISSQALYERQSWYVGVCTKAAAASKEKTLLTPQHGFWILQYQKGTGFSVNTDPVTPVPVAKEFKKLGVYLDCDKHTLSFYNATDKSHLCTLYNIPPLQTLVPLVCPGIKDNDCMQIGVVK